MMGAEFTAQEEFFMKSAWQASREATIDECANICKNLADNYDWPSCCAVDDCENAILELKDKNEI